ncbi:MAG: SH3-like domain-containing protein [Calditrichaceae bacterium]|nr:SH3-like domain-containing protein [Calditrichaceae bacterium]
MNYKLISILSLFIITLFACQKSNDDKPDNTKAESGHKVKVVEVTQAKAYTYLKVKENSKEYWMAINKSETIKEDDIIYYNIGLEMKNFKSEDLNRIFDTILFVEKISDSPMSSPHNMPAQQIMPKKPLEKDPSISIEPISGSISIAELYNNSRSYSGKKIKIKGKVTKVNPAIMGKNWVHLQDGSEYKGQYDLTITTQEKVNVGDVVVFEGIISLNKDFGFGYAYGILMEEANLLENQTIAL